MGRHTCCLQRSTGDKGSSTSWKKTCRQRGIGAYRSSSLNASSGWRWQGDVKIGHTDIAQITPVNFLRLSGEAAIYRPVGKKFVLASAPFLVIAPVAEPEPVVETAAPLQAPEIKATPVFAAPVEEEHGETDHQAAPAPVAAVEQAAEPVRAKVAPPAPEPDHEIAATAPQPAPAEPQPAPSASAEAQAEARRHAIHGAPEDPAPAGDSAPKKAGWWSKRKTG